jgi:hypothetical protein
VSKNRKGQPVLYYLLGGSSVKLLVFKLNLPDCFEHRACYFETSSIFFITVFQMMLFANFACFFLVTASATLSLRTSSRFII